MTGWIVAAAIYAVAALWVPITLGMANKGTLRGKRYFFRDRVMPLLYTIFWPIALLVAIIEWMIYR